MILLPIFMLMKHYHYIFAGAGLSSLMTVYKLAESGFFSDKSILLLDTSEKKDNDRTWCFWESGKGNWDEVVIKSWNEGDFIGKGFTKELDFENYSYKMVQGIDFYTHVHNQLKQYSNITFAAQKVIDFKDLDTHVLVKTDTESYTCNKLFNSIYNPAIPAQRKYPVLQQHFKGWFFKIPSALTDSSKITFMDFSIPQKGNTRFMYVLPVSENEILVEYTLFSEKLLPENEYDAAIKDYLETMGINDENLENSIQHTEKGSIPMTSFPFWKNNTKNVLNIGSAGGWTKASTGYTFKNTDKISSRLIQFLRHESDFRKFHKKTRFWFYDMLLLDILYRNNEKGSLIFSSMFKKARASLIFKFLDEETSPAEDLKVILKCPKGLFVKALWRNIF